MIDVLRAVYGEHLTAADLELACQVTDDHTEELMATVRQTAVAARAGTPPLYPGPRWLDRLEEVGVPVTIVGPRRVRGLGEAIARRAGEGRFVAADAYTDLVWLEDRAAATAAISQLAARLSGQQGR